MVISSKQSPLNTLARKSNENKELALAAQEIKMVQSLVCNNAAKRSNQIPKLGQWLQLRSQSSFGFTEEDFLRIWKGLYYNMWMSDKPLIQEALAEQLAQLVHSFGTRVDLSLKFFDAFLQTMCQEWFGIDQWRIDKFLMLVRRMLRHVFLILKESGWSSANIKLFNKIVESVLMPEDTETISGLVMHLMDCFLEELAKVGESEITAKTIAQFVQPFLVFMASHRDLKLVAHCRTRIVYHLLYQSSLGRQYKEKYNAWKQMGFATSSIDNLEAIPDIESNDTSNSDETLARLDTGLDPRAGDVDVFMPELQLDAKFVVAALNDIISKHELNTKRRNMLKKLLDQFTQYEQGEFPLGIKRMPSFVKKSEVPLIQEKINQLERLEEDMLGTGRKLKQLNKRKRRKLLHSLNFNSMDENNFDQVIAKALPSQSLSLCRKRARLALMSGWREEEITESTTMDCENHGENENNNCASVTIKANTKNLLKKSRPTAKSSKCPTAVDSSSKKAPEAVDRGLEKDHMKTDSEPTITNVSIDAAVASYETNGLRLEKKLKSFGTPRRPQSKKHMKITEQYKACLQPGISPKRVKIALKHNTAQKPSEYLQQIKSSPNVPYDATRKPGKGLLKPNAVPSPINPFYKKKIGLHFLNDTL